MEGYDALWFIGDNFAARTYRPGFEKGCPDTCYIKENFEFRPFINSRYSSTNQNMPSRIVNTVASAINSVHKLPTLMIIVLDDDIIQEFIEVKWGVASAFGIWLEWIVQSIDGFIQERKKQLPFKAVKAMYPTVMWVATPHHANFNNAALRTKFNICLTSVIKNYHYMKVIKLKEIWEYNDSTLVVNSRVTADGDLAYWKAINASVKYNHFKMIAQTSQPLPKSGDIRERLGPAYRQEGTSTVHGTKIATNLRFEKYRKVNGSRFKKHKKNCIWSHRR